MPLVDDEAEIALVSLQAQLRPFAFENMRHISLCLFLLLWLIAGSFAIASPATKEECSADGVRTAIVGDALLNEGAYELLATLSDRFGPRMIGTPAHKASLHRLESELRDLGISVRRQDFTFPGWVRGEASVRLLEPIDRNLRAAALGYVSESRAVEGQLMYLDDDDIDRLEGSSLDGSILLLSPNLTLPQQTLQRLAADGVIGALLINRVGGGQLLARVANHRGEAPPFPLFSITQEEGFWARRLLQDGESVRARLETSSHHEEFVGSNLIATLPGDSDQRIVLGGHFDSWDLGQGAMDNGLGVAQIFEVARLLQAHSPFNRHAVELVWFDAEEFGLWGSRHYVEAEDLDAVRVMVNLDMVGRPIALNAMGFDELVPTLEAFTEQLGSWTFEQPVANKPWLGSDHHPFILKGVPSITFNAPIDPEDVRHYHDHGDSFDKVDRAMLARASAIIALLIHDLANSAQRLDQLSPEATAELFRKAGLEERMKKADQWPFDFKP